MAKKKRGGGVLVTLVVLGLALVAGGYLYKRFFSVVELGEKKYVYIYVGRSDKYEDVLESLINEGIITDEDAFDWLARKMKLPENIFPGKYRITSGLNMRRIINQLKYGKDENVKLFFNSQIRDLEDFIEYADEKLELSEEEIRDVMEDEKNLARIGDLDPGNSFALVVPGERQVNWAISSDEFLKMLEKKFASVWTNERKKLAAGTGFSIGEIITIASIVQSESSIKSEQRKIAGVYINRLKRGMALEADPTLKFANRNFDAKRVYDKDKLINSPYNTYMYKGLPPGPICLVNSDAIDATLRYEKHNYIFFCAKPELNGYSNFSATYEEHKKYARAYRRAIDELGISR